MALLAQVSGIGEPLAERLLAEFGSIAGVASASEAELTRVRGVGPRRAAQLRRMLVSNV